MSIGIIATLKAQEGKQSEFEAVFAELSKAVRVGEPGNKLYSMFRSRKDKNTYIVMEIYDGEEALNAHRQSEHFRKAGPKIGATLAGPPDIHYLDAV